MKYYEMFPIQDSRHNIFDTITYVATQAGMTYKQCLIKLGFGSTNGVMIFNVERSKTYPHFRLDSYVARKLNDICREADLSLRIVPRPINKRRMY